MLTREQTLSQYAVSDDGYITSRGRFCGEPLFVPHFFDRFARERRISYEKSPDGKEWAVFKITKWEREQYPELARIVSIGVREEKGKVLSWTRGVMYIPTVLLP